jgi:hypothetical protein
MAGPAVASNNAMSISWDADSMLAHVRYVEGASLQGADGVFLVDALRTWVGSSQEPFAVLADGTGLRATNGDYRAHASRFFREHRERACIALVNLGPVIHIVVEMFRIGTGIALKEFGTEADARAWLRQRGIRA